MDSSDIDNALVARLGADATLLSYCPHGVWWDEAPQGSTRFVIVSLVEAIDVPVFGRRAIEDILYEVEVRMLSTAGGNIKAAAARIDALLEDLPIGTGSPTLTPGYTPVTCYREMRHRLTEIDALDPSLRWLRRGGQYRVTMSVTGA